MTSNEKQQRIRQYIIPDNLVEGSVREVSSPDGQFRLVTARYKTGERTWDYTEGRVYRVGESEPLAIVCRNYSTFWHSWVMDHPSGTPYLLCGEDYQNQTWVDLSTGEVRSTEGEEFCWYGVEKHLGGGMLWVKGCYWGGPAEFALYDFRDPNAGPVEICWYDEAPMPQEGLQFEVTLKEGVLRIVRQDLYHKVFGKRYEELEQEGYGMLDLKSKAGDAGDPTAAAEWDRKAEEHWDSYQDPSEDPTDWEPRTEEERTYEIVQEADEDGDLMLRLASMKVSDRLKEEREKRAEALKQWRAKRESTKCSPAYIFAANLTGLRQSGWTYGAKKALAALFPRRGADRELTLEAQVIGDEKYTIKRWQRGEGSNNTETVDRGECQALWAEGLKWMEEQDGSAAE